METIDKLYLELSQITTAMNSRDIKLNKIEAIIETCTIGGGLVSTQKSISDISEILNA